MKEKYLKNFTTYQGYDCMLISYVNNLKYYGVNLEEEEVFLLGGGLNINYENRLSNKMVFLSDIGKNISNFLKNSNIKKIEISGTDYDAKEFLKENINKNIPIIIKTDASFLKYNPIYLNAQNASHYINIIGYNENQFMLSDGCVPQYPPVSFQGWQDIESIQNGHEKKQYKSIVMDISSMLSMDFTSERAKKQYFKELLYMQIKEYLYNNELSNQGIGAIISLKNDLKSFYTIYKEDFGNILLLLNNQIRVGGLISSRLLFKQIYSYLEFEESNKSAQLWNELCEKWNIFCFTLIKAGLSSKEKYIMSLQKNLEKIIEYERKALETLII